MGVPRERDVGDVHRGRGLRHRYQLGPLQSPTDFIRKDFHFEIFLSMKFATRFVILLVKIMRYSSLHCQIFFRLTVFERDVGDVHRVRGLRHRYQLGPLPHTVFI